MNPQCILQFVHCLLIALTTTALLLCFQALLGPLYMSYLNSNIEHNKGINTDPKKFKELFKTSHK